MKAARLLALAVILALFAFEALSIRAADAGGMQYGCTGDCTFNSVTTLAASGSSAVKLAGGSSICLESTCASFVKDDGFGTVTLASKTGPVKTPAGFSVATNSNNMMLLGGSSTGSPVTVTAQGDTGASIKFVVGGTGGGTMQSAATLPTCTAALESLRVIVAGTGGTRTKVCTCTTDGTTPAWINAAGTVGTASTC